MDAWKQPTTRWKWAIGKNAFILRLEFTREKYHFNEEFCLYSPGCTAFDYQGTTISGRRCCGISKLFTIVTNTTVLVRAWSKPLPPDFRAKKKGSLDEFLHISYCMWLIWKQNLKATRLLSDLSEVTEAATATHFFDCSWLAVYRRCSLFFLWLVVFGHLQSKTSTKHAFSRKLAPSTQGRGRFPATTFFSFDCVHHKMKVLYYTCSLNEVRVLIVDNHAFTETVLTFFAIWRASSELGTYVRYRDTTGAAKEWPGGQGPVHVLPKSRKFETGLRRFIAHCIGLLWGFQCKFLWRKPRW